MRIRRPIAVGADWALVRLASGEYLCVDTSTCEAAGVTFLSPRHRPDGGTPWEVPQSGAEQQAVDVDMTTIDDFLPLDLAVDLVKIAVEGHEPMVLRGMEQTIARSPNIRIVTEFA